MMGAGKLNTGRGIRVCLLGQPAWCHRLEAGLNRHTADELVISKFFPQTRFSFRALRDAVKADVLLRVGFRPGASTVRGRVFDAVWFALRRLNSDACGAMYWIGTDVLNTTRDFAAGKLRRAFFDSSVADLHIADAPWLVDELAATGVRATFIHLPGSSSCASEVVPLGPTFRVLTYIPESRYRFYGGETIFEAASRLPFIQFDVVAGQGCWTSAPLPNLHFHGWQENMERFYRNACVVLRLVEHDSIGSTVQEGLSFARHVLYSYPFPHTTHIAFGDVERLVEALQKLFHLHQTGRLGPNVSGWAYATHEFDEARDARVLVSLLSENACRRRKGMNT
ncbi:MAG TPA: hypothetical protein VN442_00700 [Bryobacteraceae bacterium]|nr:hypothetical protein [Bryobacteraceae bacterium]